MVEQELSELIFFDTFSHDLHETLNLDLVQFPSPVYISEIRIIPLGARVQADFPGGGNRLGATNPSQFEIEFYVNDLSVNVASTFEPLGKFSYNQNECINLECKVDDGIRKIPTDGLVLKGCYTTITLAVYGNIITYGNMPKIQGANNINSSTNPVQVTSNDETNGESDAAEVYNNNNFQHNDNENSSCDPTVSSTIDEDNQPESSPIGIYSRSPSKEQEVTKGSKREWSNSPDDDGYRHKRRKPLQSPRISRPDSDDEKIPATTYCPSSPSVANNTPIESPTEMDEEPVELEPILSDEDMGDDVNGIDDEIGEEEFVEEFATKNFNPLVDELRIVATNVDVERVVKVKEHLLVLSNSYLGAQIGESWINSCEAMIQVLHSLPGPENVAELVKEMKEPVLEMFFSCIQIGLDYNLATHHQLPGCNLRHIKAGIRLMECLASSETFLTWLIDEKRYDLFPNLLELFPRELIPMPIKLLVARLIHQLVGSRIGIEKFLGADGYKIIIELLNSVTDVRLLYTLKAILKKLHANETLASIREISIEIFRKARAGEEFDDLLELENLFVALVDFRKHDQLQPKKFLPIPSQFEVIPGGYGADFTSLYVQHEFLEVIVMLWNVKQSISPRLTALIVEYVAEMAKNSRELNYFASHIRLVNDLVKLFIEVNEPTEEKLLNVEIGIEIGYKMEAKYHLDCLLQLHDDNEISEFLDSLYNLCLGAGRQHVLDYIAMDDNLLVLLNIIDREKKISMVQGSPGFKRKSPVLSFSIDIVDHVVRYVEKLNYLRKFDGNLLNLVKHHELFEPSVAAMLQEMAVYLKPLEIEKVFEYEDITPIIEQIKRSMEFLTTFPGDLIMTLRILRHLIIEGEKGCADYHELKQDYYAMQLYHADGAAIFLSILEKLTSHFDQPMIHSYLLGANQGTLLMQVVHPSVQILRKMLVQVIKARDVHFRDVTAIETLMKTYTLMQGVQPRFTTFTESKEVQREIIRILLTYTQSPTPDGMTTHNIHKSLWTQMIGEIIKYTLNGPYHFTSGLTVLGELLPLPLPVPIHSSELSKMESQRLITDRQMWSAHLHPQSHLITEMIQTFCATSTHELFQLIYKVSVQLADLAPNMTLLVTKAVVELLVAEGLDKQNEGTAGTSRLLKFLSTLVRHPCVKVSVLSILSGKLSDLMSNLLAHVNDANVDHVAAQYQVFLILHSLFDCEISMLFNSNQNPDLVVSCGLPCKELIVQFTNDVVDNFCKTSAENTTFAAIRAMILLTDHDVTFCVFKTALASRREAFVERLSSIAEKCKNERKQMVIIPDLLELFKALVKVDTNGIVSVVPPRSLSLSVGELSEVFKWNSDEFRNGSKIHFLEVFSALANGPKAEADEEEVEEVNYKTELDNLLEQLRGASQDPAVTPSDQDFVLPQAEGIVTQFALRVAYTTEHVDELTSDYWVLDEEEPVTDVVQCDLDELVRQCLPPDTNIGSDCKRLLSLSSSPQSGRERNQSGLCFRTRRVDVDPTPGRPEKKIFGKFPPRGRGFSRAAAIRGDIFRSRPPNTSRPPSLHVDDFLAMESGQPSYNKREIISSSRGRGRGSGFLGRGRGLSSYNSGSRGHYSGYKPSFRGRPLRGIRGSRGYQPR